jgi:hypothetical protein
MNIRDLISESLETIFWVKDLNSLMRMQIRDPEIFLTLYPGSGMEKIRIRDKHPGSAPLWSTLNFMMKIEKATQATDISYRLSDLCSF